ncbi:MAG: diaminopimelate epimerase [Proteobacteria bacterium]|nr:diaminopimelate epimerase [Pseudomonadota bacterium]
MRFGKYHGLGNDFVIADLRSGVSPVEQERAQDAAFVRSVCDRRFGVGADGVLAILPPAEGTGADARMRVLNVDGSEAEMCGNGLRCVVKYLYEHDESLRRDAIVIGTGAGPLSCAIAARDGRVHTVTVDMGQPRLARRDIPMVQHDHAAGDRFLAMPIRATGRELTATAVSMGNPHVVMFVDESGADLRALAESVGPALEVHEWFPERTNVEFAHIHSPREIELVVWERSCGITLACGTGACATAVAACLAEHSQVGQEIEVHLLGGDLFITVAPEYETVFMRGPATHVFDGTLKLD